MTTNNVYGFSVSSIIRFLGYEGLTIREATDTLAAYGITPYPTIIRDHLGAGRATSPRFDETRLAPVNRKQRAELLRTCREQAALRAAGKLDKPARKTKTVAMPKPAAPVTRKPAAKAAAVIADDTRRVTLTCTEGKSDKVYTIEMRAAGALWNVYALFGRRGATPQEDRKTARPVGVATATAMVEALVTAKLRKGYQISKTNFGSKRAAAA
jgi:hypothetical protein